MDFFKIRVKEARGKKKDGEQAALEVSPDFIVGRSKDLMVKGGEFLAIWDKERGLWSTEQFDVVRLVDREVQKRADELTAEGKVCEVKTLRSFDSNQWVQFLKFAKSLSDNYHPLDQKLTFANTDVKKTDYVTRRLPYSLEKGSIAAYEELIDLLYVPEERQKFEWGIGALIAGDSRYIQKFWVFHGDPGTGKSTVMNIIEALFQGYCEAFEAAALTSNNNQFGLEAFKHNPMVAIQQDGDLSRIESNGRLNSIVSHEKVVINEKFKPTYGSIITSFLFMGTNDPVRITNAKSGLIRRLIDVYPTGKTHEWDRYNHLVKLVEFEYGAIAHHCLNLYRKLGRGAYKTYRPTAMILKSNVMANFVDAYYETFEAQNGTTLKQAYSLYKEYCAEASIEYKMPMHKFRDELKSYFTGFHDRIMVNGLQVRSQYTGFIAEHYKTPVEGDVTKFTLTMDETTSLLDEMLADQIAQYAKADGTPRKFWDDSERMIRGVLQKPDPKAIVDTVLSDLDTSKLHYVKLPENHIVIDFDLVGEDGDKSLELNKAAASSFPATYAEVSQGGSGVHLHYIWDGFPTDELASKYADGIEVKVYRDNAGLRRKLTECNNVAVATINSGLPRKEKKMLSPTQVQSEKGLRELIARNLRKEIHPGTKPSIDFIAHILQNAYDDGLTYDLSDLMPRIMAFANSSTNQSIKCLEIVDGMKFVGKEEAKTPLTPTEVLLSDERNVFFDIEVYLNLLIICWKYEGSPTVVRMINPKPEEVETLFRYKLIGFNNRGYDNHILWARFMGYPNEKLYDLSQRIINDKENNHGFGEAYNLSYADIYEFSSIKKSLKKWMIELGLDHIEMGIPWDEPVPPEMIDKVVEYCVNDVVGTEAVFNHLKQDFVARQILAELSGLPVNNTTAQHTAKIIFGGKKNHQSDFVYTKLANEFPGYEFDQYAKTDKSKYRGEVVGEGGYVYAEPDFYTKTTLLDVTSMHPTSIHKLDLFGVHTEKFWDLVRARVAIKNAAEAMAKEEPEPDVAERYLDEARDMLDGKLAPYLESIEGAGPLAYALKIVINIVYGLTSASFPNPFRDPKNIDNIVAKRGALFMIDLKNAVREQGFTVAHIKTDSIKIPDATPEIIEFVMKFGEKYGYSFTEEATYDKFVLVNDAVYIAKQKKKDGSYKYTAVGAEFQHPYVFKTLFSGEDIGFDDMCETRNVVKGAIYLVPEDVLEEREKEIAAKKAEARARKKAGEEVEPVDTNPPLSDDHLEKIQFVGRVGRFTPVTKESGGRTLMRVQDGKMYAVTGTKGYHWAEAVMVQKANDIVDMSLFDVKSAHKRDGYVIDLGYFQKLADSARATLDKFGGGYTEFVSE